MGDPSVGVADEVAIDIDLEKLTNFNSTKPAQNIEIEVPIFRSSTTRQDDTPTSGAKTILSQTNGPSQPTSGFCVDDRSLQKSSDDHSSSQSDRLYLIKAALSQLESYSLQSSEDINDCIEQLVSCFNGNTAAL